MHPKRKIEVFSAGCPICEEAIALVGKLACTACDIEVLEMQQADVAAKANAYGVQRVPAVAVNGQLVECCSGNRLNEQDLRAAGIGSPNPH